MPEATPKTGRVIWVTGVLLLLVVFALVAHLSQGRQFAELLKHARPGWLAVAIALQGATYLCAAGVWYRALVRQGHDTPLGKLFTLGLAKVFVDQAVPSGGISGTVLVARALRRRGLPNKSAVNTVLAGLIAFYIAYALAVASALLILWINGGVSKVVFSAAAAFSVVVAAVPATILWMTRRSQKHFPAWLRRIGLLKNFLAALNEPSRVLRDPRFLIEATALQLGVIILDAATIGVLLYAVGSEALPSAVFAAFTMASAVATVSPIPSGLGTFDGTLIALLRAFRVPLEAALAATILFRGFALVLPMLPGFLLARREAR
ncbi:MAG: flippase-like domain-containing protein [Gemmatimonadetes bacterium]|nr:flippase-like domain-containing protein [Gemmatimonadota bacterium]